MIRPLRPLLLLLLLLQACGRTDAEPKSPTPLDAPSVEIVADGRVVAHVDAASLDERRCLPELLPGSVADPAHWVTVQVHATDGRLLNLGRPARTYPNQDFCLYRSKEGHPSFGVYRRDDPTLDPRVRELRWQPAPYVVDVARVSVRTVATAEEAAARTLTIVVDGGEGVRITPAMLDGLVAAGTVESGGGPGGGGHHARRGKAWPLRAVLALVVEPDRIASLRLVNVAGDRHDLAPEDLKTSSKRTPTLKRNRRGDHHLRILEGQRTAVEVRSIVRIEVRTAPPR